MKLAVEACWTIVFSVHVLRSFSCEVTLAKVETRFGLLGV